MLAVSGARPARFYQWRAGVDNEERASLLFLIDLGIALSLAALIVRFLMFVANIDMTKANCSVCHGLGWVCENHPTAPGVRRAAVSVAPACPANAIGLKASTFPTLNASSRKWKASRLAPATSDGTDFLDARCLGRQRGDWLWALEEAHCFGCSASRCRSFCFSHCSGITKGGCTP